MMQNDLSTKSREFLQHKEIHTRWESDYLNPEMDHFYDLAFQDILRRLQPTAASTILDAGCGYCYHTVRLARSGAKITAVDFSEIALTAARETIDRAGITDQVSLRQADLTSLPFHDASFDYVVSWGVLMHIPQLEKALSELARVLKPGGVLVLSENNMRALDVSIRERLIHLVKRALWRPSEKTDHTVRGIEVQKESADGILMVRKTDMAFLQTYLRSVGLRQIARTAGQLTEAYTNMPSKSLKRLVYSLNSFYFKHAMSPDIALGNIIYFQK
jgi:ubiquinone/menaquinone biosynthesis C-methylase UbiE